MNDPKYFFEPYAGLCVDIFKKMRGHYFVPHSLTKLQTLRYCKSVTGAATGIEIGSYKGVTTRRMSHIFDEVYSVEIDKDLFEQAKKRCRSRKNVTFILGDGMEVLNDLAPSVSNALLYLDGHFSGGETSHGEKIEPVLQEIDAISDHLENFVSIVIDDFRLFGVDPGWPSKSELLFAIERKLPEFTMNILHDQIILCRSDAVS